MKVNTKKYVICSAVFAFLLLCGAPSEGKPKLFDAPKCNVILISVDTCRADRLGCYGYSKPTSPGIDAMAEESVVFENAFSQSSLTAPSHTSMFTSYYLPVLGFLDKTAGNKIPDDVIPLAEACGARGLITAGFVGGAGVSHIFGLGRGFGVWSEKRYIGENLPGMKKWLKDNKGSGFFLFFHFYDVHTPYNFSEKYYRAIGCDPADYDLYAERLARLSEMNNREKEELNNSAEFTDADLADTVIYRMTNDIFFEKHSKAAKDSREFIRHRWRKMPEFEKQLEFISNCYDAGIRYADERLGHFFDFLKKNGMWDDALIILTSDHGEEFMEHHRLGHGGDLYDTLLHVPLIVKMPRYAGVSPKRVSQRVESLDIMPTILEAIGGRVSPAPQGKSLMGMIKNGDAAGPGRGVMTSASINKKTMVRSEWRKCLYSGHNHVWKYFVIDKANSGEVMVLWKRGDGEWRTSGGMASRFDLDDLKEKADSLKLVLEDRMKAWRQLRENKFSKITDHTDKILPAHKEEHLKEMRALGYL